MKIKATSTEIAKKLQELQRAGSAAEKTKIVLDGSESVAKEASKLASRPSKALQAFASAMRKINIL